MTKQMVPRHTAESMAQAYHTACKLLKEAFENIKKADKMLAIAYNRKHGFLPYELSKYSYNCLKEEIRRSCWRKIVDLLELPHLISSRKKEQLYQQIDDGDVPEITTENILHFCMDTYSNLPNYINETIEEVTKWLQPTRWNTLKTNEKSKYEIQRKVIKKWVFNTSYGIVYFNDHPRQMLTELDNIFHMLDGKGIAKYPDDLATVIQGAIKEKKWEVKTEYFHIKWFKNGNAHITFLREDLLKEFNIRQGEGKIKGKEV